MIKSFKAKNFLSIGKEQEVNFSISKKDILNNSSIEIDKKNTLNKISCLIGGNATGKSSILKSLCFLISLIDNAYKSTNKTDDIGITSHKIYKKENNIFKIEFFDKGELYKYKLEIKENKIKYEYLGVNKERSFSKIFEYKDNNLDTKLKINKIDLERFKDKFNTPFLSSLIATEYLKIDFFRSNTSNIKNDSDTNYDPVSNYMWLHSLFKENANDFKHKILKLINKIDISISDFVFKPYQGTIFLHCNHSNDKNNFDLPLLAESHGTQKSLNLLARSLKALELGKIMIIDEIEEGLHIDLVKIIISLFSDPKSNLYNAAINIFHTPIPIAFG